MSSAKKGFGKEMIFIMCLSSVCIAVLLLTRIGVGTRSEVSGDSVKAVLTILAGKAPESVDEAFTIFNRRFVMKSGGKIKVWQNQDLMDQWAFEATGAAMWGEMTIVGVVDMETSSMLGLKIVNQCETAGLGSKVAEPTFCEQFINLNCLPKIELSQAKFKNNQFDAVSGATVTSRSLEIILNRAIDQVRSVSKIKS